MFENFQKHMNNILKPFKTLTRSVVNVLHFSSTLFCWSAKTCTQMGLSIANFPTTMLCWISKITIKCTRTLLNFTAKILNFPSVLLRFFCQKSLVFLKLCGVMASKILNFPTVAAIYLQKIFRILMSLIGIKIQQMGAWISVQHEKIKVLFQHFSKKAKKITLTSIHFFAEKIKKILNASKQTSLNIIKPLLTFLDLPSFLVGKTFSSIKKATLACVHSIAQFFTYTSKFIARTITSFQKSIRTKCAHILLKSRQAMLDSRHLLVNKAQSFSEKFSQNWECFRKRVHLLAQSIKNNAQSYAKSAQTRWHQVLLKSHQAMLASRHLLTDKAQKILNVTKQTSLNIIKPLLTFLDLPSFLVGKTFSFIKKATLACVHAVAQSFIYTQKFIVRIITSFQKFVGTLWALTKKSLALCAKNLYTATHMILRSFCFPFILAKKVTGTIYSRTKRLCQQILQVICSGFSRIFYRIRHTKDTLSSLNNKWQTWHDHIISKWDQIWANSVKERRAALRILTHPATILPSLFICLSVFGLYVYDCKVANLKTARLMYVKTKILKQARENYYHREKTHKTQLANRATPYTVHAQNMHQNYTKTDLQIAVENYFARNKVNGVICDQNVLKINAGGKVIGSENPQLEESSDILITGHDTHSVTFSDNKGNMYRKTIDSLFE